MKRIYTCLIFVALWISLDATAYYPITANKMPKHAGKLADPYPSYPKIDYGTGSTRAVVKRGEYLSKMGDCIACHTAENGGKPFAGGYGLKTPFGTIYTNNITPDKETGIGNWSFDTFKNAMRNGKRPDGSNYYPAFPYPNFTLLSDQDLRAIFEYLKRLPAVKNQNKAATIPFPFNMNIGQSFWRSQYFKVVGPYQYDNTQSPAWNRGAYLVEGLGHCTMCHTPKNLLGADKKGYHLSGAFIDGFWAPNINKDGLANNSVQDIVKVFTEDRLLNNKADTVAGPMAAVNHDSLAYINKTDLTAMATYLKTVDASTYTGQSHATNAAYLSQGRKVYQQACALCHNSGQLGAPKIVDSENWALRLKKGLPALYRNVMYGYNSMPVKGNCQDCSDQDIKAAVNYVVYKAVGSRKMKEVLTASSTNKVTEADGKHLYKQVCAQCHSGGVLNAPKLGDKAAWKPIIKKNVDELVKSAMRGNHKKPYMSGCRSCTTADIKAAVKYMVQEGSSKGDYSLW